MQSLCILGRQPALGLAELESLYGSAAVHRVEPGAALLDVEPADVNFVRLGGSIKHCRVLNILNTTAWDDIEKYLLKTIVDHLQYVPEGKLQLGLSAYGIRINTQSMLATGLSLKKVIKKSGRSVRLVPNKEIELNSASVLHNNLTGPTGWELVIVRSGQQTILAQTMHVQDIDSYTIRDRDRPKRDPRVGMLPPKLAQIIINLAGRHGVSEGAALSDHPINKHPQAACILDPFCGTGVILQEARLMGYDIYGTDLEPRMIEYTQANLAWLSRTYSVTDKPVFCEIADATEHHWQPIFDIVACETYLGRPFTELPNPELLQQTVGECNVIITKFLRNLSDQITTGTRLCLAVPAWQVRRGQFKHLRLLDSLAELGYNRISFEHTRNEDLIYYREDQVTARELLILEKI